MGRFEEWEQRAISRQGWVRIAVRPADRAEGRALLSRFKPWFVEHGRGRCMLYCEHHTRYSTIAFSDLVDSVLFRLTFTDVPLGIVPQPRAHEDYRIGRQDRIDLALHDPLPMSRG